MNTLTYFIALIYPYSIAIMFIGWIISYKTKDATMMDILWSFCMLSSTIFIYLSLNNFYITQSIIALLAAFWSIRLMVYLSKRWMKSKTEDSRYKSLRKSAGANSNLYIFLSYQLQAIFVVIFIIPIAISLLENKTSTTLFDIIGICVFIFAITGEYIADNQLYKFKQNHSSTDTCNIGLWKYSRHPNYFFEWLHWFSYVFFSINSDLLWVSIISPFIILFFLFKITGITHVEREALKNKPDYKNYMKTTSKFFLWRNKN